MRPSERHDPLPAGRWPPSFLILLASFAAITVTQLASRAAYGVVVYDQADLVLFSQTLEPVYDEQVPVYAWALTGLLRVTGYNLLTPDALKLAALFVALLALYRMGTRMTGLPIAGLVAALSAFLLPTVREDLLREYTHSSAVIAFSMLSFACLIGERKAWPLWLAWVGGLLSKHNMAIVIASQLSAGRLTGRPLGRKGWTALGITLVITLPVYALMLSEPSTIKAGAAEFVGERSDGGRLRGLGDLAASFLGEGALLLLGLGFASWRLRKGGGRLTDHERFLIASVGVAMVLFAGGVLMANISVVRDRWLAPSLLALCPVLAAWMARGVSDHAMKGLAGVLVVAVLAVTGLRAVDPLLSSGSGQGSLQLRPYPRAAALIAARAKAAGAEAVLFEDGHLGATVKARTPSLAAYGVRTKDEVSARVERLLLVATPVQARTGWLETVRARARCGPSERVVLPLRYGAEGEYAFSIQLCEREAS